MARSVLVSAIMTGARERADDEAGALAEDAEVIRYIDAAWTRLYSKYIAAEPDRFRTEATLSYSGATAALPADWLATIGVDYEQDSSTRFALRRLHEAERNIFNGTGSGNRALAYRCIGSNVVLYPTPPTGQTYKLIYLPTATALSSGATSIDCRNGHDQYLEMLVARRLLEKEEAYDGRWEAQIGKIEAELEEEAHLRYLHEPELMHGVDHTPTWPLDAADYRWTRRGF